MPRTFEHPKYGISITVEDDATDEQINARLLQAEQEQTRRQTGAGAARAGARSDLAEQVQQAAPPTLTEDPMEALAQIGGADPRRELAIRMGEGMGAPGRTAVVRHLPAMVGGAAGSAAKGSGLLMRMLLGEAGLEAGEAAGAAATGEDPLEAARRVRGYGAGGELLGTGAAGVSKVVGAVRRGGWLKKAITPAGREAMEVLPGQIRPAQAVEGTGLARAADLSDAAAGSAMFGGGRMEAAQKTQQALLRGKLDDFVDQFGQRTTAPEAGKAVREALKGKKEAFHTYGNQVASEIDATLGGSPVSLPRTQQALDKFKQETINPTTLSVLERVEKRLTEQIKGTRTVTETTAGARGVTQRTLEEVTEQVGERQAGRMGERIAREAGETGLPKGVTERARVTQRGKERIPKEGISFAQAQDLLTDLNRIDEPTGAVKQLRKALWKDMDEAARVNPQAREMWAELGSYWREGYKKFGQDFAKKIIENADLTDAQVLKEFLKDLDPGQVNFVKNTVGKDAWRQVESAFAQDLIGKAIPEAAETLTTRAAEEMAGVSGKALNRAVRKTYGPATVKAVLGDEAAENIAKLARVLETTQAKGVASGRLFIQMKQAGAVTALAGLTGGLITGDPGTGVQVGLTAGGIWIGGPLLLSRIMTSPKATQYLLEGLQANPATPEAARAVTRLSTYLSTIRGGRAKKEELEYQAPWVTP